MPAKKKAGPKKKAARKRSAALIPADLIPEKIAPLVIVLRREKILLDSDLAELYGVTTGRLNEAVQRNLDRFPDDFMFQLTEDEHENLLSQIAIAKNADYESRSQSVISRSKDPNLRSQIVTSRFRVPFRKPET